MGKSSYGGMITREQFCFYEMRTVAKLICDGKNEQEVIEAVVTENLFQYPTERSIRSISLACFRRLMAMNNSELIQTAAYGSIETAKQICLYAMMKYYPIVWDFMVRLIGEKYRLFDMSFGPLDMNTFFMNLQSNNDEVAGWSDSTINKIKQVLRKMLIENEYLDNVRSDHLNPVMIESCLETAIRESGDLDALAAFNCLY